MRARSRDRCWTELLQHLLPVRLRLHVDEVADDDPPHVAQPHLPRDLARRVDVGLEDGLLRVLLPRVAPRVHVDRDQRLGGLHDDVAARGGGWTRRWKASRISLSMS